MRQRALTGACLVVALLFAGGAPVAVGQTSEGWTLPRTQDGHPDLQGVWANNNITPLERPEVWAGRAELTDEELASLRRAAAAAVGDGDALFGDQLVLAAIQGIEATSYDPTTGNYNQFWIADRDYTRQTSLVVDPPDGRVPDLVPEAQERFREAAARGRDHPADTYTDRPLSERCVTYGVPRLGAGYNSYYQVFQSDTHVVILNEMIHDARVIPLTDVPHPDEKVRLLHGDSRGHWDGDTLVIETTNFSKNANFRGSSDNLRMTERLTREGPQTLRYEVTLADATVWIRPWTASIPLAYSAEPLFEYACHEGNIGMEGILAGHRADEREAVAK
jgi:hypothetical protein